jgi:hypothetical protein
MKKDLFRQIFVALSVIATILINALAEILPINGLGTGQISDSFKTYFVPAGYVFSIWGVIYLALIVYAIFQLLPSQRENPRMRSTGYLFILSSIANCAWIFLWHYELFLLTLVIMVILLVSLIMIYVRLGIGSTQKGSAAETWMVRVPFSIYLGWITVATIANVTTVLVFYHWSGLGIAPQAWAVIMLGAGVIIAGLMAFTRRDVAFLGVLVWAFAGIAAKFQGTPLVYWAALISTTLVLILAIFSVVKKLQKA